MKANTILKLKALSAALEKAQSIDLGELEDEITSGILSLDNLARQNSDLDELYTKERLDLIDAYKSQETIYRPTS